MAKSFIIIGAGIVGISAAIWLQRAGHIVTIIDKEGPAAGASQGNAGVLASGSLIPVTTPGLLKKAPKMLFSPKEPLFLRWRYLPKLIPFLFKYLKHANEKSVNRIADGLYLLLKDSPEQHIDLAKGTPAEAFLEKGDYLFAYENKSDFEADAFAWEIRKRKGIDFEELDADALAVYDSTLKGRFGYAIRCKHHGKISDPATYINALADYFVDNGGEIQQAELAGFNVENGHCTGIKTSDGMMTADSYMLTTGAWSSRWRDELGVTVPMESERGYHLEFVNPSINLRTPLMVASGKFVVHSMNGRMRCAGVVEFGGLEAPATVPPITLLHENIKRLFPDLSYDYVTEWLGHRPATADSLPVIGLSPKATNIYLGYGHHHIGLSGGPKTGRWLSILATNGHLDEKSDGNLADDLSIYAADREI